MIAANLAVAFLVPFSAVPTEFAFDPSHPSLFTALTCLFLHDPENILHLLGNLVFLAAVGPMVETQVGPLKFAVVYVVSGVLGVLAHWLVAVNSGVGAPLIGASSAIAGCVGYCTVRFARRSVPLAPKLHIHVGVVALIWLLLQVVGAFVNFSGSTGTSFIAHIGGFVGGVLLAFVLRAQMEASAEVGRERLGEMVDRSPAAALAAAEKHLEKHANDPVALWERAAALHSMGDRDQEAAVLIALVREGVDVERALDCLVVIDKLRVLTAVERMRIADSLNTDLKRIVIRSVASEPDAEPQRPNALLALAELVGDDEREEILRELSAKYEFHAATEMARAKGWVS